jgi:predicted alpha/beta hydrolase
VDATTLNSQRPVELTAVDGVRLAARLFDTNGPAQMTAVMLAGIGVPQRAFRHLAAWLSRNGVRCLTLDFRGVGESADMPGAMATARLPTWAQVDAVAALEYAESRWSEPVVLIGHSFGGQVVGLTEAARRFRAVVMLTTGFGLSRHFDGIGRLLVELYWRAILPFACALFEVLPPAFAFGNRLPRGVAKDWARYGRSPDWFLTSEPGAAACLAAFDRPVLSFSAGDDGIVPPRAVEEFAGLLVAAPVERRHVEPADFGMDEIGHVGLFRPGPLESEWRYALEFLRGHVG